MVTPHAQDSFAAVPEGSSYSFPVRRIIDEVPTRFPGTEVVNRRRLESPEFLPSGGQRPVDLIVPAAADDHPRQTTSVGVFPGGLLLSFDGNNAEVIAAFLEWVFTLAPPPPSGEVVLAMWGQHEMLPLTPDTTVQSLLAVLEG